MESGVSHYSRTDRQFLGMNTTVLHGQLHGTVKTHTFNNIADFRVDSLNFRLIIGYCGT